MGVVYGSCSVLTCKLRKGIELRERLRVDDDGDTAEEFFTVSHGAQRAVCWGLFVLLALVNVVSI